MRNSLIFTILALTIQFGAQAQAPEEAHKRIPYVEIVRDSIPDCVRLGKTELHFPGSHERFDSLYVKIEKMLSSGEGNVNIWHIGGSHVQGSYFPDRLRQNFAAAAEGEYGYAVPYRMISPAYDKEQFFSVEGQWDPSVISRSYKGTRPRYGITGFGARTSDSKAAVAFSFKAKGDSLRSANSCRILGYSPDGQSFPIIIKGCDTLFCQNEGNDRFLFELGEELDSIKVNFHIPEGSSFVLGGIEPLNGHSGFIYYASGTNGASLSSWLNKCDELERDLAYAKPDIAILGLGINDSACKQVDFKVEVFKERYRQLIGMVRRQAPGCSFIFITNNDSYRYISRGMTYNYNAPAVKKAMFELAEEVGAAVWDLYDIMGGKNSVNLWRDAGLVQSDRLHFTKSGYNLLGDLLYNAFADDYNKIQ